jgi:hypothetical protein
MRRLHPLAFAALLAACQSPPPPATPVSHPPMPDPGPVNGLTAEEKSEGFVLLFDGKTTRGWQGYRQKTFPDGWQVVKGALTRVSPAGDIITDSVYGNFDLRLDWMISTTGNSGIFYRVTDQGETPYESGPEYQILDNVLAKDGGNLLTVAGACYGLYPSPRGMVRPVGEWNVTRIVVNGNDVQHWLNGIKVVQYQLGSADWEAKVKASKFAQWPEYGRASRGYIGLQDHGDWVSYRSIRIRVLP